MSGSAPEAVPGFAGADITIARFVKASLGNNNTFIQGTDNARTCGIATNSPVGNGIYPASTTLAAQPAQGFVEFLYYPTGAANVLLEIAEGISAGAQITSDADGKGVNLNPAASGESWVGAIAQQTGAAGAKIPVQVVSYPFTPASTVSSSGVG